MHRRCIKRNDEAISRISKSFMKALILLLTSLWPLAAAPTTQIKVDQVGYLSAAPKVAFVVSAQPASDFNVRRRSDDSIAFRGKLTAPVDDADSGDRVLAADFTKLEESGSFYLEVPGVGRSWNFTIGADVYARAFYLSMRAFYRSEERRVGKGCRIG